jgi:hypothetical protein
MTTTHKLIAMVAALLSAATIAALLAPGAWAPPVPGLPNIGIGKGCIPYGHAIPLGGAGFEPGTQVTVSAPPGHYVGPTPFMLIPDVVTTAGRHGEISVRLRAPSTPRHGPRYQARVVFASGTGQADHRPEQSYDEVVIATPRLCHILDSSARAPPPSRSSQGRTPRGGPPPP